MSEDTSDTVGNDLERRLAALLHADVVGYSRLTEQDEETAYRMLSRSRELISECVARHNGRIVNYAGDEALAEFRSVSDAVTSAVDIQHQLAQEYECRDDGCRMQYRIGVNLGEVLVDGDTIYGDGVNVAARLQQLADPGGICISDSVRRAVGNRLPFRYDYLGEKWVKNLETPVRVFRLTHDSSARPPSFSLRRLVSDLPIRLGRYSSIIVLVVFLFAVAILGLVLEPWSQGNTGVNVEDMQYPLPEKPSIAVLPLNNLTGNASQGYFADGVTETLTTELARDHHLFVIARNSAFVYKNKTAPIQKVARELGVRYVLEGSIQQSTKRVRINVQLIDAVKGSHVWAERYDRSMEDFFSVQDEIVRKIVATLRGYKGVIQSAELERSLDKSEPSLDAFDHLMRGMMHKERFHPDNNQTAREHFKKAIEMDPDFAPAYGWLAWTHFFDVYMGWGSDPAASLEKTFETARRSVALDPSLDFGYWALGAAHLAAGDNQQSLAKFNKALELNPNNSDVLANTAWPLSFSGNPGKAIDNVERAMRLNPHHPDWYWWGLGIAHFTAGNYSEAIEALERMVRSNSESLAYLAASLAAQGKKVEAGGAFDEILKLEPRFEIQGFAATLTFEDSSATDRLLEYLRIAGENSSESLDQP